MEADPQRLKLILGGHDLGWLLRSLRTRFERGGSSRGRLSLPTGISLGELEALNRLLGRRLQPETRSVDLGDIEAVLAQAGWSSLREAIEVLTGPCVNRREERLQSKERWIAVFAEARARVGGQCSKWRFRSALSGFAHLHASFDYCRHAPASLQWPESGLSWSNGPRRGRLRQASNYIMLTLDI